MSESSLAAPRGENASTEQPPGTLQQWQNGLRISHIGHSQAESFYRRYWRFLGVGVIVVSSLVGTTIFASLESSPSFWWRLAAGILSLAAAVGAALQTFLGFGELADRHRDAARAYGTIPRQLEQELLGADDDLDAAVLEKIRVAWDDADQAAPALPQRIHDRAFRIVKGYEREH
jgi:hypothetical protein